MNYRSTCYKCGNSIKETTELCDDGNIVNGDGCSSQCQIETNYLCNLDVNSKSICQRCGDGKKDSNE